MTRFRTFLELLSRHPRRTAAGVGVLCTIGLLLRMFVPSAVGLSDQGDGNRLLCELGLRNDVPWAGSQAGYVNFTWVEHRFYGETCGANGTGQPYYSSQLVLLRIAGMLGRLFGLPGELDLRGLAVLCCVLAGVAIGWLVAELPGPVFGRVLVGLGVGFLVADSGVAVYFASPYSEPAGLLGVLFLCPAVLRLVRQQRFGLATLCAVVGIAAFTLTSKTQLISLLPALVLLLVLRSKGRRVLGALAAAALVALSAGYFSAQPARFNELDQYNQVFGTILPSSPDREGDLRWFGLDPALARGAGSNVLSANSVAADPAMREFTEKVSTPTVTGFYLTHPGRIWGLVFDGLKGATTFRLSPYVANYPQNSGEPPYSLENRFEFFTWVFSVLHGAPTLLLLLWVGGLAFFWLLARRGSTPAVLGLVLVTGAVGQFAAVMITEGATELVKHMLVVDFLSALCLPVALAALLAPRVPTAAPAGPELVRRQLDDEEFVASRVWADWEIEDAGKPSPVPRHRPVRMPAGSTHPQP